MGEQVPPSPILNQPHEEWGRKLHGEEKEEITPQNDKSNTQFNIA